MFQNCTLLGRTTKDIELKFLPDGTAVSTFYLAVDRKKSLKKKTDFIPCVVWGDLAKEYENIVGKGSLIMISGEINSSLKQEDGVNKTVLQFKVNEGRFIQLKKPNVSND